MLCRDEEAERAKPRAVRDGWQAHDEGVPGSRLRRKAFARLCSTVSVRCDQTRPRSITSMSVVTGSDRFGLGIFTVSGASPSNRVGVQIPASAPFDSASATPRPRSWQADPRITGGRSKTGRVPFKPSRMP